MSRLSIDTQNTADKTVEELYKDLERRVQASQPGLCPVDLAASFLKTCYAQSCGKCVPCRVGLGQLEKMLAEVLDGPARPELLDIIERTAQSIYFTADCAIGSEAARMILKGVRGFREDYIEHIEHGRCKGKHNQPVPCVAQCPAHVDIPGYIALIHEERYTDAVQLIRKDNPFPSVCGLICEHPCEVRCRRTLVDDAVNIRGLKRYACDHSGELPVPEISPSTGKKVAVIGGGPSGLSAAFYLSIMGHEVTVYEQRKQLGGMLRYGIPNYRLPRTALNREIDNMKKVGFKTICNVSVGRDISWKDIRDQNDAVYVAIGAHTGSKMNIEGDDAEGIISAVDILRGIGDDSYPDFTGQDVAVVGGGNVAMDVARTAIRCGAKTVRVLYRRRIADMTALPEEIHGAIEDGCEISELLAPLRIEKNREGKITAIWVRHQISGPMVDGRPTIVESRELEDVRIGCDVLLVAVGQGIDSRKFGDYGIPLKRGRIDARDTSDFKNIEGVFAGGDCVTGPATVIRAIAAGKVAAANIDEYLGFNHVIRANIDLPQVRFDDHKPCGRVNLRERPAQIRKHDFELMETGMTHEEAWQESSRCLRCDHFGYGVFKGGREVQW